MIIKYLVFTYAYKVTYINK